MNTTLQAARDQYLIDHVNPTTEAWEAFKAAAQGAGGDSIAAYMKYRTLLRRAESATETYEAKAIVDAMATIEAQKKAVNVQKEELENIHKNLERIKGARRSTQGMYVEEMEAANSALNEIAAENGFDIHRSPEDLTFVNVFNYVKDKPMTGSQNLGYSQIPCHDHFTSAVEHLIAEHLKQTK